MQIDPEEAMPAIVECVPNFSEGRDRARIDQITAAIAAVPGVTLLDVDPGAATHRTVVTFTGDPDSVLEAAFQAIKTAAETIDMRRHQGEHARMGATDVCPFVPVSGISMAECAALAERLGERVGRELEIPVYLYEQAARSEQRRNLAEVRAGEYEGLGQKLADPAWRPDFGPAIFGERQQRTGATVIGARPFLIAWNFNLNTRDAARAHDVAITLREKGRLAKDAQGKILKDAAGNKLRQPGRLPATKCVGWYIPEFRRAQISMNLTDFRVTPMAVAFDAAVEEAAKAGLRVTGAEVVGLVPLEALLEAGRHYLARQGRCTGQSEAELLETAVQSMGLSELYPFKAEEKVVDYRVSRRSGRLVDLDLGAFADLLASDAPAPGGGSTAALCGALGAALAAMVANLTHGKKGLGRHDEEMDRVAAEGQRLKARFLGLMDEDTEAFAAVMAAMKLPKGSDEERAVRGAALEEANRHATLIPFQVVELCGPALELAVAVAARGNPNSLSDAGVAALCLGSACDGAAMNVRINLAGIADKAWAEEMDRRARGLQEALHARRTPLLAAIEERLAFRG
ncbi:MAG: glutamate formimidoyltransferase [bacterium]|nr:glutamate formimidoyltransferase [bacterium]